MDGNNAETAECIIKKGKRQAAYYIRKFCANRIHPAITNEVFDTILNPSISIDDWDAIDWCRRLLAGGKTPEEFAQTGNRDLWNEISHVYVLHEKSKNTFREKL